MKKSKYAGVHQRKNGTWYYRIKKTYPDGKIEYYQKSGFTSEEEAYQARRTRLQLELHGIDALTGKPYSYPVADEDIGITFEDYFVAFLSQCQSAASIKKYKALYTAQLVSWGNRDISTITDADIDVLLLKLTMKGLSHSYIASIRKMLKLLFKFARHNNSCISVKTAQLTSTKPYKLRVLSLFSGIGAPERALDELGIPYDLVGYCEFDNKASVAYSLLHEVGLDKDLVDVENLDSYACEQAIPNFDILFAGFPCQDLSRQGKMKGFVEEGCDLPTYQDLLYDRELNGLTRSGLVYRALQIIMWKRPKFVVFENADTLMGKRFRKEFYDLLQDLQVDENQAGYNIYFDRMNSQDYGIPQNRNRTIMVMIRRDLNMLFHFPDTEELTVKAEDWFEDTVENNYYFSPEDIPKLQRDSFRVNFNRDVIACITTKWGGMLKKKGTPSPSIQQTVIKDSKGIRCLTIEEMMRFQGFRPEDAQLLRENGYSNAEIGKLVGNSITVPVIRKVIEQLVLCWNEPVAEDIVPYQIIAAPVLQDYLSPLFAYTGNKYKLLPYLEYVMPAYTSNPLHSSIFVDLFAGSGTIALNLASQADRVIINDVDSILIGIYKALSVIEPSEAWKKVSKVIEKYNLSATNKEGYWKCRADYNEFPLAERDKYWYHALAIIYFSFNTSTIAYNQKSEVNSSFGEGKSSAAKAEKKFFPFAERLFREKEHITFTNCSFKDFSINDKCMDEEVFYYVDPPYLVSEASYNKYWSEDDDRDLYAFLDKCSERGERWVLSNALENNGERNEILAAWLKENRDRYIILFMNRDYKHCSYNRKNKGRTIEVLVMNFTQN